MTNLPTSKKPVEWMASSKADLRGLPQPVRAVFGFAVLLAELGEKHPEAKPLKGFGGAGVLEVVENWKGDTYRAVYTVNFPGAVYVIDAFQKKSKKGSELPKVDMDRIMSRLKLAREHYEENYKRKMEIAAIRQIFPSPRRRR